MLSPIDRKDLVLHFLNVGFGDNILIEFPANSAGKRSYALVDCRNSTKTRGYLNKLIPSPANRSPLAFICATHPHGDHISGINPMLKDATYSPREFWDSGFRHKSDTYLKILKTLRDKKIRMVRVAAGMERYFGRVRITILSPSVALRNQYATYGVDMNNASIVLRIEHHGEQALLMVSEEYKGNVSKEAERESGKSVVILTGDAEFDAWAQICRDYPKLERPSEHKPLVKKMINYLSCEVVKVAHHGSMHSTALDVYEKMDPNLAIMSTKQEQKQKKKTPVPGGAPLKRNLFPHPTSVLALEEAEARIITTDGSYESQQVAGGGQKDPAMARPGSVVVVVPPGRKPRWTKLSDAANVVPNPPILV